MPKLTKYFDWISVMTYDFHGHWDKQTGHVAPLYYYPGDTYDYFNAVSNAVTVYRTSSTGQASRLVIAVMLMPWPRAVYNSHE